MLSVAQTHFCHSFGLWSQANRNRYAVVYVSSLLAQQHYLHEKSETLLRRLIVASCSISNHSTLNILPSIQLLV